MGLCKCCKQNKYNTYYRYVPVCLKCFRSVLRTTRHYI